MVSKWRAELSDWLISRLLSPKKAPGVIFSTNSLQTGIGSPMQCDLERFETQYAHSQDGSEIGIWYKPPEEGKHTYVVFHGREGNWAVSGTPLENNPPNYNDPTYRKQWLEEMAKTGAGVVAVHTRGFGASKNPTCKPPANHTIEEDMEAVYTFLTEKKEDGVDLDNLAVAGESLGGGLAAVMAGVLTDREHPPKILGGINSFSSISQALFDEAGRKKIGKFSLLKNASFEKLRDGIGDPLNSVEIIKNLSPMTRYYNAHATDDERMGPEHPDALRKSGVSTVSRNLDESFTYNHLRRHTAWIPKKIVEDMENILNEMEMEAAFREAELEMVAEQTGFKSRVTDRVIATGFDIQGRANIVFSPRKLQKEIQDPSDYGLEGFEVASVKSKDNTEIGIWHKPAKEGMPTFVAFHGRRGNWGWASQDPLPKNFPKDSKDHGHRHKWLKAMADSGAGVIAIHTRGFGLSDNESVKSQTPADIQNDMKAIYAFLQEKGIDPTKTIVTGESMGGGMAALMARIMANNDRAPKMVSIINSFSDFATATYEQLHNFTYKNRKPFANVSLETIKDEIGDFLNTYKNIKALPDTVEIDILHAPDDELMNLNHPRRLVEAAEGKELNTVLLKGSKWMTEQTNRHCAWKPEAVVEHALNAFRNPQFERRKVTKDAAEASAEMSR